MRNFWTLLGLVSLAGNVVLALVLVAGAVSTTAEPPISGRTPSPAPVVEADAAGSLDATVWSRLGGAADLPGMIAHLRAEQFPPAVIRAIVTALLEEKFAAKRKALDPAKDTEPFWKSYRPTDAKIQAALSELAREQRRTYRALLGAEASDAEDDPIAAIGVRRQYGFLPSAKAGQVREIIERHRQLTEDIYDTVGTLLPADRTRILELNAERDASLAQALSPSELEDYNLRSSRSSDSLRSQLVLFDPTEAEFRALYPLRRAFEDKYLYVGVPMSDTWEKERKEAQNALNEQYRTVLSPARYEDFVRSSDFDYRRTALLVTRLQLPPETTQTVWSVQKETQQRVEALERDETLPEAQRRTQLTTLAASTAQRISTALGPRAFDEYQNSAAGNWLRTLASPASAPKK